MRLNQPVTAPTAVPKRVEDLQGLQLVEATTKQEIKIWNELMTHILAIIWVTLCPCNDGFCAVLSGFCESAMAENLDGWAWP
jgi:hypothetical protein